MTTRTDPARELADLCDLLRAEPGKVNGAHVLAAKFQVTQWSSEFYEIIFAISKRIDDLNTIVHSLKMDEDHKRDAESHLNTIRAAFGPQGLNNNWQHSIETFISMAHVQPIKMLSVAVRPAVSYPKLDGEELEQLIAEVTELRDWLTDQQLADKDFIRQALLDGVSQFLFRLQRIGWLGWGYTIESLRDVISAYIVLEYSAPTPVMAPDAVAVLKKTRVLLGTVMEKTKLAKENWEAGEFILKAYGAVSLLGQAGQVVGLLPPGH